MRVVVVFLKYHVTIVYTLQFVLSSTYYWKDLRYISLLRHEAFKLLLRSSYVVVFELLVNVLRVAIEDELAFVILSHHSSCRELRSCRSSSLLYAIDAISLVFIAYNSVNISRILMKMTLVESMNLRKRQYLQNLASFACKDTKKRIYISLLSFRSMLLIKTSIKSFLSLRITNSALLTCATLVIARVIYCIFNSSCCAI